MATTFEAIARTTVGSGGASTITFSSIPATYTDLALLICARITGSSDPTIRIRCNGDSGANYSYVALSGSGSGTSSYNQSNVGSGNTFLNAGYVTNSSDLASIFSNNFVYIENYTASTNKNWYVDGIDESNVTANSMQMISGLWSNSAVISSLVISQGTDSYAEFTTATLYGIKNS